MENLIAAVESQVDNIIPHRSRMKLVDRLVEINSFHAVAAARVSNRWPLFEDGGASCLTAVELVAQTSAGVFARRLEFDLKKEEVFGFIAGIKEAHFQVGCIEEGTELIIRSQCPHFVDSDGVLYGVFDGTVHAGEKLLAGVSLQILRPKMDDLDRIDTKFQPAGLSQTQTWDENWLSLNDIRTLENNKIEARSTIAPNSAWFDGHFPDRPLLPGVALIGLCAKTFIQREKHSGRIAEVIGFKKVRFKDVVLPNQELKISLIPTKAEAKEYRFEVMRDDTSVCGGILVFRYL